MRYFYFTMRVLLLSHKIETKLTVFLDLIDDPITKVGFCHRQETKEKTII